MSPVLGLLAPPPAFLLAGLCFLGFFKTWNYFQTLLFSLGFRSVFFFLLSLRIRAVALRNLIVVFVKAGR